MQLPYKLRDWIDKDKLIWYDLNQPYNLKKNFYEMIIDYPEKINWPEESLNKIAIDLLEENMYRVIWQDVETYNNKEVLEDYQEVDNTFWTTTSEPESKNIDWWHFTLNPNVFVLDYEKMKESKKDINREIIEKAWHPSRVAKLIESGIDTDDIFISLCNFDNRMKQLVKLSLIPGLLYELPDINGLYDGLILPKEQYIFLFRISWLSMFSGIYALYQGYYDLAPVPLGVWLTSINYWRKPDYSWRRYVDMFYVYIALTYQVVRAYKAQNATLYYAILAIGVLFYPIGVFFHKRGDSWLSTLCHGQVHVFGNISNVILYAGHIRSIAELIKLGKT